MRDDTSHKQYMAEQEAYKKKYLCGDCDFNYRTIDELGMIDYCAILEWYEDTMRELKSCPHYRVNEQYPGQ